MKRSTIKLFLIAALVGCFVAVQFNMNSASAETSAKESNPATINGLDKKIYGEIVAGNTDSLFVHLQMIYRNAGWKDQEKTPVLEKQRFDIPFSRTSNQYITQSELMTNKSQAWQYWQMWSDSLTYGKWNPHSSFKEEKEAFEVGNFTAAIIMAHELGHYYSEANDPGLFREAAWENAADHYAMGLLRDLTATDAKLKKLLQRFREVFMGEIYDAIPDQFRSKLEPGFNLYEHIFFVSAPEGFKEYASMQLVREGVLLDNPQLTTRSCRGILKDGNKAVASGDKINLYRGQIGIHYFATYSETQANDSGAALSKFMMESYGFPEIGCFDNGEVYSIQIKDSILTLTTLSTEKRAVTYDFTALSSKLDSIAGYKVIQDQIASPIVFLFRNEEQLELMFLVAETDTQRISLVTCSISFPMAKIVNMRSEKLDVAVEGELSLIYRSHNAQTVILELYDWKKHETHRLRLFSNEACKSELIETTKKFDHTPDLTMPTPIKSNSTGLKLGVDPLGNELVLDFFFAKYRSDSKQYTVYEKVNGNEIGTNLNCRRIGMIWSPKYGFINYDSKRKCAVGIKF